MREIRHYLFLAAAALLASPAQADISGVVYQDFNSNGVRDTTTTIPNTQSGTIAVAVDAGLAGVSVTAACVTHRGPDGVLGTADDTVQTFGPVTTNATGAYTITTAGVITPTAAETADGKRACRVSFSWNESAPIVGNAPNPLYGMRPTFVGSGSNTATQFVNDGATNVDLGLNLPAEFCQNNPDLVANCALLFGRVGTQMIDGSNRVAIGRIPYSAQTTLNANIRNSAAPPSCHFPRRCSPGLRQDGGVD
ncbi:MAG: hypothetical protein RMK02_04025, partial [Burkholderiales bacterium]|nr:hypothetical protein [Burkholderiales bacterium]